MSDFTSEFGSPGGGEQAQPRLGATVVAANTVKPRRPVWCWPGRLAYGKLAVLDGNPGQGKSTLTLDIAARLSTGRFLPGVTSHPQTTATVLLNAEDAMDDTIVPRLTAAGADLSQVYAIQAVETSNGPRPWSLPADIPELRDVVEATGAGLVVIDPLMAFLSGSHDAYKDADVRRALHPLADMARDTGCCVLVVRHLRKSGGKAIHAGSGSIGIGGAARTVLVAAEDPDRDGVFILAVAKNNIGPKGGSLAYTVQTDDSLGCGRIHWMGGTGHTADDLMSGD